MILLFTAEQGKLYDHKQWDGSFTIKDNVGSEGTDTLTTMEKARFSDVTVTLATGATLSNGEAIHTSSQILHAVINRLFEKT